MCSLGFSHKQIDKFYDLMHEMFSQKKHLRVLIHELRQLNFIFNFYNCTLVKYYTVLLRPCCKNNKSV